MLFGYLIGGYVIRDHAAENIDSGFSSVPVVDVSTHTVGANINGAPSGLGTCRTHFHSRIEMECCSLPRNLAGQNVPCCRWARIEDEAREAGGVESPWREQGALPPSSIRAVTFKVDDSVLPATPLYLGTTSRTK